MSGICTGAPYAVLDATSGINLDTYKDLDEMLRALYYRTVVTHARATLQPGSFTAAQYCDHLLAYMEVVHTETRGHVVRDYDPARLRAPEVWPFTMNDKHRHALLEDRYYAFSNTTGGGVFGGPWTGAGSVDHGYVNRHNLLSDLDAYLKGRTDPFEYSFDPEDLGNVEWCIITGRQYVDRLYWVCESGGEIERHELSIHGTWAQPPEKHALGRPWAKPLQDALLAAEADGYTVTVTNRVDPTNGIGKTVLETRLRRGHY